MLTTHHKNAKCDLAYLRVANSNPNLLLCIVVCVFCVCSLSFGTKPFSPSPPALDCVDLHNSSTQFWVMFSMDNNGMFVCQCMYVNQRFMLNNSLSFAFMNVAYPLLTLYLPLMLIFLYPFFYIVLCSALEAQYFLPFFSSLTSSKVKTKPVTHSVDTLVVCGDVRVTVAQNEGSDTK